MKLFDWVSLDWIYWAISWILLRWHELWDRLLPDGRGLGTNWDWVLAIIFLVLTTRVVLFPLVVKQIKTQRAMQALQPKMKALQEKHKGDNETLRQEMAKLYQEEGVNPLGCMTIFLQIPVFFAIFHLLRRIDPVQTKNTTLYGWTQEQWDSSVHAGLFGAPIYGTFGPDPFDWSPDQVATKLVAGLLVAIMIVTTYLTSRQMILKTGWSEDPNQRMIQRLMLYAIPASLLVSGGIFPIGVVIYWVTTNLFSLGQQQWVLHKYPMPQPPGAKDGKGAAKDAKDAAKGGKAKGGKAGANGEEPAKIDGKALAPRPGVKPVKPKKSNRKRKARR